MILDNENIPKLYIPSYMHNTDKLYINEGTIYKIFNENSFIEEKERNINFLINNHVPNTPAIYEKIYSGNSFVGYSMEYIQGAITFREAINHDVPLENKIKAITDIYESMKYLHNNGIYLGDIHSDNMLITEDGHGFLIDLEEVRFPGDEFKFKQCYLVKPNNQSYRINIPDKYTDNVKLMISSLSLLLDKDLEEYISKKSHDINLEELYNDVIKPLNDDKLDDYFNKLINNEEVDYFGDLYSNKGKSLVKNR